VSVGGHDPVELLGKLKGRVPLMHLKDKANGTANQFNEAVARTAFKEVGNGTLDWPKILKAADAAGVETTSWNRTKPRATPWRVSGKATRSFPS